MVIRYILKTIAILAICVTLVQPTLAKRKNFTQISAEILTSLQSANPVASTMQGVNSYDNRLADYSSNGIKAQIKALKNFEKALHGVRNNKMTADQRVDFRLTKSNLDIALQNLNKIKWYRKMPQIYIDEAVNGIHSLMVSDHVPMSEKIYSLISRMKAVPALFKSARKNIKSSPPVWNDLAKESLESAIEFYRRVGGTLMNKFPEKADEILKVSTAARESMNDFLVVLAEAQTGVAGSYAVGKANIDYMLTNKYHFTFDSDSLLRMTKVMLNNAQNEYAEYEAYVDENHQNGRDSVFVPATFTREDMIGYYAWESNQVMLFIDDEDIISIPADMPALSIEEMPAYLAPVSDVSKYIGTGSNNGLQTGRIYIRPIPLELDRRQVEARFRYVHRRGFRATVVHSAFPGHYLQQYLAKLNSSEIRKWQNDLLLIEGWALYADELMYRSGLFGDEDAAVWLKILKRRRDQAAMAVAQINLQTGVMNTEQAADWLISEMDVRSTVEQLDLRKKVLTMTLKPFDQVAPILGYIELGRLFTAAEEHHGTLFVESDFYDRILRLGAISPALMWEALSLVP